MNEHGIVVAPPEPFHCTMLPFLVRAVLVLCACMHVPAIAAALVVDVQGGARTAGGNRLAILTELPEGGRVDLDVGARVGLVLTENRRQFELAGPGAFRVTAGGIEPAGGSGQLVEKRPLDAAFRDLRLRSARVAQASIPMRGDAAGSAVRLLTPVSTWLLAPPASFSWQAVPGATSYRVQITDGTGKPMHEARTEAATLATPANLAFQPGRTYAWQVDAVLGDGRTVEGWTEFGIADGARRSREEAARAAADAPFADRVLYAMLLDDAGLREAARAVWEALARERPEDTRLRAIAEAR